MFNFAAAFFAMNKIRYKRTRVRIKTATNGREIL